VISLNRARWQGGGFADDLPRARRILPYFRSAYAVMRRLSWAETQIRTFESAIDRLGVGMALVDADARCGYYNAAAEYAISARQGLSLVGGTFRCTTPDALRSLCAALTLAAQGALPSPQRIHIRNAAGVLRFVLIVTMLRGGTMGLGARRGNPCAAIFIHAPSAVPESPETLLQQAFGLTRAEARLAALLAVGMPPNQCAETLRVSLATIRTQIRSLFGKTGARRHGELVSLSEFVLRSR
jgi:DNA-binding CsgD family transcriptional regulator